MVTRRSGGLLGVVGLCWRYCDGKSLECACFFSLSGILATVVIAIDGLALLTCIIFYDEDCMMPIPFK